MSKTSISIEEILKKLAKRSVEQTGVVFESFHYDNKAIIDALTAIHQLIEKEVIGEEQKVMSRPFKQHFGGVEKLTQKPVYEIGHRVRDNLRDAQRQALTNALYGDRR